MIQYLKNALSEVLLSFSIQRCQVEAMMKIDFKIGHERTNLMQLCFSNLAGWPLLLLIAILYFDPTKNSWSLQQLFQQNMTVSFWLLDGRLGNMALFFGAAFFLQWIFRQETVFTAVIFYFLLKSDIHFHLAVSAISGIVFARSCYLWWMHTDVKSRYRKIWVTFTTLQLAGWLVASVFVFYMIDNLQFSGYFSESVSMNRFEFTLWSLIIIYFTQFLFSSLWGHLSFQKVKEPSEFPICYSTTTWILRFKMRPYFKKQIKDQTAKYLLLHEQNLEELKSIKDLSPVSIPAQITNILQTEIEYLKTASSKLTID